MASDREFVTFVCEQLGGAGEISSRRMFGEAAVYLQDRVVDRRTHGGAGRRV
jgi:TfoX/Sxy family transcriptional regulator of competence genes